MTIAVDLGRKVTKQTKYRPAHTIMVLTTLASNEGSDGPAHMCSAVSPELLLLQYTKYEKGA